MESIDMYIYIGHESSVGVCFHGEMTPRRVAPLFHARWRVSHDLVLVFAATRRHLALRVPALVIERAGRHVAFLKFSS